MVVNKRVQDFKGKIGFPYEDTRNKYYEDSIKRFRWGKVLFPLTYLMVVEDVDFQ